MWFGGSLIRTVSVPPGGPVTVVVVAYDCDQYSSSDSVVWWFSDKNSVSTTWRAVTVVVVANDCDQYSVVVTVVWWFSNDNSVSTTWWCSYSGSGGK